MQNNFTVNNLSSVICPKIGRIKQNIRASLLLSRAFIPHFMWHITIHRLSMQILLGKNRTAMKHCNKA